MIDSFQALVLAIVQGLTEFLPISSSGHLILVPSLLGWADQGLAFDVAVHFGSLLAVVTYFIRDIKEILLGWFDQVAGRRDSHEGRLGWMIVVATIPAGVVGMSLSAAIESKLRAPMVVAAATILFGLALWWADHRGERRRGIDEIRWRDALLIGMAQVLALIPGTSRSGITITAGLAGGLTREAAARFSFLISIPIILAAAGLKTLDLIAQDTPVDWGIFAIGVAAAAVSAYLCIRVFLKVIERMGLMPFVIYRLILGVFIIYWFW